ncbi:MAG: TatD family hydrolase [Firmicutes bacterium]|nr:TatD family hydrolase [Bacillota bacterium]
MINLDALLADSHCHILDSRLACQADEIVANLVRDGLEFIIEIGADPRESIDALEFALKHPRVFSTAGVHPQLAKDYDQREQGKFSSEDFPYGCEFERWLIANSCNKKLVAVGECGLDYHYPPFDKDLQANVFRAQIRLANQVGLPLIVHTRDAFDDTLRILLEEKSHINNGLLMHCFSENKEAANLMLEHFGAGVYFAFGGGVTYDVANATEVIKTIPLDRILLETDSPYMNPKSLGGKKVLCLPKNVRVIAEFVATAKGEPLETVMRATLENTKRFFSV